MSAQDTRHHSRTVEKIEHNTRAAARALNTASEALMSARVEHNESASAALHDVRTALNEAQGAISRYRAAKKAEVLETKNQTTTTRHD